MRSAEDTSGETPSVNNPLRSRVYQVLAAGLMAGLTSCASTNTDMNSGVKAPATHLSHEGEGETKFLDGREERLADNKRRTRINTCRTEKSRLLGDPDTEPGEGLQACSKEDRSRMLLILPLRRAYAKSKPLADEQRRKCLKTWDIARETQSLEQILMNPSLACKKYTEIRRDLHIRFEPIIGKFVEGIHGNLWEPIPFDAVDDRPGR